MRLAGHNDKIESASIHRRRRVIVYFERAETRAAFRLHAHRSMEMIAASDLATVEAALRVYSDVDAVIAEKSAALGGAVAALRLAQEIHPSADRLLILENEAMTGISDALHNG